MANIWDEFDKAIDTEGLAKDVEEAAENGGRREVPHEQEGRSDGYLLDEDCGRRV